MIKNIFLLVLGLLTAGCASRAVQTEHLLENRAGFAAAHQIKNVAFIDQTAGHCGPSVLTMAMNQTGYNVSVDEISPQVFTPGMKGSLQSDMITASRRNGMMAVQIKNMPELLAEVKAGHPVIVLENLAFSWLPQWHYALVLGYDLEKEEIIMHSGHEAYRRWSLHKFERSWMLAEYWGLVILPPGELAPSAGEIAHVTAAVGLEQAKKTAAAEKSYRSILKKWPSSLVALIGLANIAYADGRRAEAIAFLQKATQFHPDSQEAKHNLKVALTAP